MFFVNLRSSAGPEKIISERFVPMKAEEMKRKARAFVLIETDPGKEKEVMEEPETLLKNPKFAIYTIFLILAFVLSALIDKINQ